MSAAAQSQDAAWDLLQKARSLQTLHQDASPTFHVAAEFHTFDTTGAPNGDGTLDEVYERGGSWKRTVVYRGAKSVKVKLPHERAQVLQEQNYLTTFAEGHVLDALFSPIRISEGMARSKVETRDVKMGSLGLKCVVVSLPAVSEVNTKAVAPNNVYCIDPQSGLLRVVEGHNRSIVILNNFVRIGETNFVKDVAIRDHGMLQATLHVTALEGKPEISPATFAVPEGAVPETDPFTVPVSLVAGKKIGGMQPRYPENAKRNHIQGEVVLRAIIGRGGRVRDLELESTPDDSLVATSLEAVKTWTFTPYLLDGKPTEVRTTITVNYAIQR